jgi:hypothetical protein
VLPSGGSISTTGGGKFFILIQIYKLVLVLPLSPYPYLSLLCLSMPWESTFVGQPLSYFFSQILFIWLITSMSYCHLDLVVAFFLSILFVHLAIHFLSRELCHLGLLRSFSDNFICGLSLLDQGHYFDAIIYHQHHIILFHYLPFVIVHHIISSAWLDDQDFVLWRLWRVKFWM